jgi:uncharacterized protein (DUF58 family)
MTDVISQLYQRVKRRQRRKVYIMPTRFGFMYAALLVLILLGAVNYNNSLGHILCFLLASMGWVSMHHCYRNIAKIDLIKSSANPVFLGQKSNYILQFRNASKANSYQIELTSCQQRVKSKNPFKQFKAYYFPTVSEKLNSNKDSAINYRIPTVLRGRNVLGKIRLSSQFPLGLFTSWTYFKTDVSVLVYPLPKGDLPLPHSSNEGQHSQHSLSKGSDDFSALNNYRSGDPLNSIAWKALARDDVLRVKQFTGEQGGELVLSWQDVITIHDTEARLSQLCQWIISAEQLGLQYGLKLPGTLINIGSGHQHQHHCLTALALYPHE